MGWLARRHGLSRDDVASYELITAEGERLHVDEAGNPELFWALGNVFHVNQNIAPA